MLNIVCNEVGVPDAVLIRAVEPIIGFEQMVRRRGLNVEKNPKITSGPGKLTKALAIDKTYDGECLLSGRIRLFTDDFVLKSEMIVAAPRIGVEYAGADALLPWRFYLGDNKFVSRRS
jgi:DNA-3-methyladenine glycosylase